jgi:hypothetical protein
MHVTNKAFERYFQRSTADALAVYGAARHLQHPYNTKRPPREAN